MVHLLIDLYVSSFQIQLFKESSNFGKFIALRLNKFENERSRVSVLVTWGLKEQDLDKCHFADAECTGKTVWDDSFSMSTTESQKALLVIACL